MAKHKEYEHDSFLKPNLFFTYEIGGSGCQYLIAGFAKLGAGTFSITIIIIFLFILFLFRPIDLYGA